MNSIKMYMELLERNNAGTPEEKGARRRSTKNRRSFGKLYSAVTLGNHLLSNMSSVNCGQALIGDVPGRASP